LTRMYSLVCTERERQHSSSATASVAALYCGWLTFSYILFFFLSSSFDFVFFSLRDRGGWKKKQVKKQRGGVILLLVVGR
jgi:hypothetical protein